MKIGLRILLGYFVIVALAAWLLGNVFVQQVKPGVRQAMEDTLADTANVLAELATDDFLAGRIDDGRFAARVRGLADRDIDARNPRTKARVDQLLERYLDQFDGAETTLALYRAYVRTHISPYLGWLKVGALEALPQDQPAFTVQVHDDVPVAARRHAAPRTGSEDRARRRQ